MTLDELREQGYSIMAYLFRLGLTADIACLTIAELWCVYYVFWRSLEG